VEELADALRALDGRRVRCVVRRPAGKLAEFSGVLSEPPRSGDGLARVVEGAGATLWLTGCRLLESAEDKVRVELPGTMRLELMLEVL
jgi:hypothetical protein